MIFDFDGTLVDTAPLIISTMQAAIRELRLPSKSDSECRATIGLRLEEIPGVLWSDRPGLNQEYARTYRRIFDELKRPLNVRCFHGVIDTLKHLHDMGYRLAVASSRSHKSLVEYAETFGITELLDAIVGGNDVKNGKPAPDAVLSICGRLAWEVSETLVVGDATFDIEMGRNAGAMTCGVTYGNQSRSEIASAHPDVILDSFPGLIPVLRGVEPETVNYVELSVIPRYAEFDKAHREDHVRMVIEQSLKLAERLPELDVNMVYVIAAFHDLGLVNGRERHHLDSGKILAADEFVRSHFSTSRIAILVEAVEDHRASNCSKPRSDYGMIVAEADRFIDAETILRRTVQYGLANYPELDMEGHYRRTLEHLIAKYGPDGYLKVWIPWSDNAARLVQLHKLIADRDSLRKAFNRIYSEEIS